MKTRLILICCLMLAAFCSNAQLQQVAYKDGVQVLNGQLIKSGDGNKKPGILILPAWMGIDQHSKDVAEALSKLGYNAFIADIYGVGKYPHNSKEAGEQSGYYKNNIGVYQQRIKLALDQLLAAGTDPNRIVVIGYCFGGLGAIEAARINLPVKGIVSFHGAYNRDPSRSIEGIRPAMLILHGADDRFTSIEDIRTFHEELNQAHADWRMIFYSGAVHAFTDPAAGSDPSKGTAYNERADKRSWQDLLQFLKEIIP